MPLPTHFLIVSSDDLPMRSYASMDADKDEWTEHRFTTALGYCPSVLRLVDELDAARPANPKSDAERAFKVVPSDAFETGGYRRQVRATYLRDTQIQEQTQFDDGFGPVWETKIKDAALPDKEKIALLVDALQTVLDTLTGGPKNAYSWAAAEKNAKEAISSAQAGPV